jgi:type I restriction enzyme S subunit
MKRYDSYKDSGVNWIGAIPTHWIKKKLGYSIETIVPMRDKPTSLQGEIPWIRIEDYNGKYIYGSKSNQGVSKDLINEMNLKVYPINTVLTTCSCSFGTTMIVKEPMTSNQTFIGLFPNKIDLDEEFLYYQLHIWKDELDRISSGSIQQYLSRDNFKSLRFLFPPLDEQQKIVVYLDKKTYQIDALIQKKLQKISLLKEYRTSLINEVVTKGLDPNVVMKDSGVEWIGQIPSHWNLTKHKFNLSIFSGFPFKSELFDHYEGFPIIRIRDITTGKLQTFYKGEVLPDYVVHKGDLLVGMDGDYNIRWWDSDEGLLNQRCCSIIESENILRRFLFYILPMELKILNDLTYYTTVKHLSVSDIYNTITILPPLSEQNEIVSYLDEQTEKIDSSIQLEKKKIELLKEYRQSLISEVVTGKIKVF